MISIHAVKLTDILPRNLAADKTVAALSAVVENALNDTTKRVSELVLYARIDELDEGTIDALAWQFHVDFYDVGVSLETKRKLVRSAIKDHKYKGTPWAVRSVVRSIRDDVKVEEWNQYGGNPYHFRLNGFSGEIPTGHDLERLVVAIDTAKNVRSWLDGVSFIRRGGAPRFKATATFLHKSITVGIQPPEAPHLTTARAKSVATYQHKEVRFNG